MEKGLLDFYNSNRDQFKIVLEKLKSRGGLSSAQQLLADKLEILLRLEFPLSAINATSEKLRLIHDIHSIIRNRRPPPKVKDQGSSSNDADAEVADISSKRSLPRISLNESYECMINLYECLRGDGSLASSSWADHAESTIRAIDNLLIAIAGSQQSGSSSSSGGIPGTSITVQALVGLRALLKLALTKKETVGEQNMDANQRRSEPPRSLQPAVYVVLKSLPKPVSDKEKDDGRKVESTVIRKDTVTLLPMKRKIETGSDSKAFQLGVMRHKRILFPTPIAIIK